MSLSPQQILDLLEGNFQLSGGDGCDQLHGDGLANSLDGGADNDFIFGLDGDDVLYGNAGNDVLIGGLGNDVLIGGEGVDLALLPGNNSTYWKQYDPSTQTFTLYNPVWGTDTYTGVEFFRFSDGVLFSTYDLLANNGGLYVTTGKFIEGTIKRDTLIGGDGDDRLFGGDGPDTLMGGAGDDYIWGGRHPDKLYGGEGNDLYIVEGKNDLIFEDAGPAGGNDTVYSSTTYTLSANVENLVLTGMTGNATGNDIANLIIGTPQNNRIHGLGGDDILIGGGGRDTLYGDAGNDIFMFTAVSDSGLTNQRVDIIKDFTSGQDLIDLSGIDADTSTTLDDAFSATLLGATDTFTAAGQLKFSNHVLYGNVDADADPEFSIVLGKNVTLTGHDLVL